MEDYNAKCFGTTATVLRVCPPTLDIEPVLWIPMSRLERSRCLHRRLGWMPSGKPWTCRNCSAGAHFSRNHAIHCLKAHRPLHVPPVAPDPIYMCLINRQPVHFALAQLAPTGVTPRQLSVRYLRTLIASTTPQEGSSPILLPLLPPAPQVSSNGSIRHHQLIDLGMSRLFSRPLPRLLHRYFFSLCLCLVILFLNAQILALQFSLHFIAILTLCFPHVSPHLFSLTRLKGFYLHLHHRTG